MAFANLVSSKDDDLSRYQAHYHGIPGVMFCSRSIAADGSKILNVHIKPNLTPAERAAIPNQMAGVPWAINIEVFQPPQQHHAAAAGGAAVGGAKKA